MSQQNYQIFDDVRVNKTHEVELYHVKKGDDIACLMTAPGVDRFDGAFIVYSTIEMKGRINGRPILLGLVDNNVVYLSEGLTDEHGSIVASVLFPELQTTKGKDLRIAISDKIKVLFDKTCICGSAFSAHGQTLH